MAYIKTFVHLAWWVFLIFRPSKANTPCNYFIAKQQTNANIFQKSSSPLWYSAPFSWFSQHLLPKGWYTSFNSKKRVQSSHLVWSNAHCFKWSPARYCNSIEISHCGRITLYFWRWVLQYLRKILPIRCQHSWTINSEHRCLCISCWCSDLTLAQTCARRDCLAWYEQKLSGFLVGVDRVSLLYGVNIVARPGEKAEDWKETLVCKAQAKSSHQTIAFF